MQHSFIYLFIRPIDNKSTALMNWRQQKCTFNVYDIASSCTALINFIEPAGKATGLIFDHVSKNIAHSSKML